LLKFTSITGGFKIYNKNKKLPFLITISYLFTFISIRLMVLIAGSANSEIAHVVKQGNADFNFYIGRNIIIYGHHIHHFYFGIILISIAGWFAIIGKKNISKEKLSIMYGVGLGLLLDEIGLLLTWGDYYSSLTYLISLLVVGILVNIIYFPLFWKRVRYKLINNKINSIFWDKFLSKIIKTLDIISEKLFRTENTVLTSISIIVLGFILLAIYLH